MGRGVTKVCGNIHASTGACQSAIICVVRIWTKKLIGLIQGKSNVKHCG